eukprot:GHVU01103357.1.p1 GENE.GHVU01103357.1~~GHVU01103357.1.p1  ORF type:complete len:444 (+),score=9.57 GHVU01103357.1:66-1397(+)
MLSLRIAVAIGVFTGTGVYGCHQELVRRQRTTWQAEANITNPNAECTYYTYPPVQAMVSTYPAIWQIADLSKPGIDPRASTIYNKLMPSIPQIKTKGTPTGDFSLTTPTYSPSDPDCWWSYSKCTTPKLSGLAKDISTCPEPSTWGLSIDDGPNCSHNAYYDYLRQANQKATLFYIGSNVIDWPLEAQRGLADGHEICAHTWSHRYMTSLTNEQVFAELYFSQSIIKEVLGVTVKCWRPPFGDVDDRVRYVASALGMTTVIWDNDMDDFEVATVGQAAVNRNYQGILTAATGGAFNTRGTIVLTHELNAATMTTNENFLPKIGQVFKYITPVGVCQNITQPYVETNFTYPTFDQWATGTRTVTLQAPTAVPNSFVPISSQNISSNASTSQIPQASATATPPSISSNPNVNQSTTAKKSAAPVKVVLSYGFLVSTLLLCLMMVV